MVFFWGGGAEGGGTERLYSGLQFFVKCVNAYISFG